MPLQTQTETLIPLKKDTAELLLRCMFFYWLTNNVDFNLSGDSGDIVLQLQGVDAFVRSNAGSNAQFCKC